MTSDGLTWHDIVYDIPLPKAKRKEALKNGNQMEDLEKQEDSEKSSDVIRPANPTSKNGPKVGDRRILDGISGGVKRGEMVGILGASGAGKTS